ncbi:MAG: ECF transporter S component [Butyrivibrio sp.]|nr:ECF transporter S component [Butyrivibrio sp.]
MKSNGIATVKKTAVFSIALCAVFTALTCVFTMFVQIPVLPAMGGIVHFGNVPLFIAAAFFGKKIGAAAGGIGMALSDLLTPWAAWAPVSLVTVGIMGFVFGLIVNRRPTPAILLLATLAVLALKIIGYYLGEVILYGSLTAPLASVPGNITQIAVGAAISIPIITALKKAFPGIAAGKTGGIKVCTKL